MWTLHCQGRCVIWDRSIIPTVWPLTCLVAPGGPRLAVYWPTPLLCVLQMGGGAVQTRAAGVHGGVPAAGLGTTNNNARHTCRHSAAQSPSLSPRTWGEGQKSYLNEKRVRFVFLTFPELVLLHKWWDRACYIASTPRSILKLYSVQFKGLQEKRKLTISLTTTVALKRLIGEACRKRSQMYVNEWGHDYT